MKLLPDNVRQGIIKLVPSSLMNEISCFVFYDNYPQDETKLDITICTTQGEIMEFYQRDLVQSLSMPHPVIPNIELQRNSVGEMFYFVEVLDSLFILSRNKTLKILKRIDSVEKYVFEDFGCRGHACLKVMIKEDAVPLIFNDNFESLADAANVLLSFTNYDSIPLITNLQRKLTETKFSLKNNEKVYEDVLKLRQKSALSNYHKINAKVTDTIFGNKIDNSLKIKSAHPLIKVCNKKIVIILEVFTVDNVSVDGVHVLLHRTHKSSIKYVTKLFDKLPVSPFWKEKNDLIINSNNEIALAVVLDLEELKHEITHRIDFDGVVCYQNNGREYSVPFEKVCLPSSTTMRDDFDILFSSENQEFIILAVLATTERLDLRLRPIAAESESNVDISDIFCKYLEMEKVGVLENVVVHRKSPHHLLYGLMAVLGGTESNGNLTISLHTRTSSQVLTLIHYIKDVVPLRIVITTTNQILIPKSDKLIQYHEGITQKAPMNYVDHAKAILNQSALTLEYLDKCMVKMNESKDFEVLSKIGVEIDVFANGVEDFQEYRRKIIEQTRIKPNFEVKSEGMVIVIDD